MLLQEDVGSVVPSHYYIISVTVDAGLTPNGGNAAVPFATAPDNYLSGDIYTNTAGVNQTVTYRVQPVLLPDCFRCCIRQRYYHDHLVRQLSTSGRSADEMGVFMLCGRNGKNNTL